MLLLNQLQFSGYRSYPGQILPNLGGTATLPLRRLTLVIGKNGTGKSQAIRLLQQVLASLSEPGNPLFVSQAGGRTFAFDDRANFHGLTPAAHPISVDLGWTFEGQPGGLTFRVSQRESPNTPVGPIAWSLWQGAERVQGGEESLPWGKAPWSRVLAALQQISADSETLQGTRARIQRSSALPGAGTLRPRLGLYGAGAPEWLALSPELLGQTRAWMLRHLPPTNLDLDTSQGELRLIERSGSALLNLADAAEGVHQALPVVTLLLARALEPQRPRADSIEQPELHLHDAMHPALGDLLLTAVGLGGAVPTPDDGQRLLVETHSEGALLRIRRRIAEGSVSAADVGLCYVDRTDRGSTLSPIPLDERGDPEWWPEGVFLERLQEAKAIAITRRGR